MIRNQRGKMSKHIDELNVDGQIYNSDNQIINGWHIHFGELAKKSVNTKFDHKHLENVEKEVKVISDICQERYIHMQVTDEEVEKAISSLNKNKAADIYGITAENIIYCGEDLRAYIRELINMSFKYCYVPDLLKIGTLLFPIFKNKGNIKDAINYRGITVTPTLSKIIEKILKLRENVKIIESQNPLQSGFTEDTTPLMCELIIEEFERENKDLKRPTYLAMLDGKSALV
ncbi:unnamed protein product [Mytilus edulis]|uniref:Reverse transcriptase domain-containing protein n=1 Tax=Mytilus edulis TaxID=6550 RepID=A0A8S3TIE1_MYTED|nr:unnamed protein product [Mytilus edulis]